MNRLSAILAAKGSEVLRIDADASVFDAVKRMVENNVGSLLVMDGRDLVGIVTERDYLRRVALPGLSDRSTAVREILSSPLIVGTSETTVEECMSLMTERRIRHLPVVEAGEVVGIVSIGDVVKFEAERQRSELKYLNEYIAAH